MGRKALLLIAVLSLAACGGGDETTTITSEPPAAESTEPARPQGDRDEKPAREPDVLSDDAIRDLERFADGAPGEVGIAVTALDGAEPIAIGDADTGRAWSTMKVPLLVALLDRVGGEGELSADERAQAEAALTASDNEAALALFDRLGGLEGGTDAASAAIEEVLRRSGDSETEVNTDPSPEGYSTFGQTNWSASDSALFFRALAGGCLLDEADTEFVLSLLEGVVADQRWGLGEAGVPGGAKVAFKGGWGPESGGGYLVRQSGVVLNNEGMDSKGYVLSVIAIPDDTSEGSFAAGQDLVSEAASLVSRHTGAGTRAAVTCER